MMNSTNKQETLITPDMWSNLQPGDVVRFILVRPKGYVTPSYETVSQVRSVSDYEDWKRNLPAYNCILLEIDGCPSSLTLCTELYTTPEDCGGIDAVVEVGHYLISRTSESL